jgi:tetratricopeptide (TPR) repeat protein
MRYSNKDYESFGRQVASGRYIHWTTCAFALALVLVAGLCLGRYVFPRPGPAGGVNDPVSGESETKRPLKDNSGLAAAVNPKQQLLQSIFQHEEEVHRDPANVEAWEHLGNLYFDADEPTKAVRAYNKVLEMAPANVSVLVDCGVMYRQLRQFDPALDYFQKALRIDPKHENALFNSGIVLYFDLQRKEEALNFWRRLLEVNPDARAPTGETLSSMVDSLSR